MAARTKSRKRALDVLYAADMRGQDPVAELDAATEAGEGPTNPYTAPWCAASSRTRRASTRC